MKFEESQRAGTQPAVPQNMIAVWLTALALVGCKSPSPLVVADDHAPVPSFRMTINTDDTGRAASQPQTGHAMELGFAKTRGDGTQSLAAGQEPIIYQNTTFSAPQQIRGDFDFNYVDISWRWREFVNERSLGFELIGGLGRPSLDLNMGSPTQQASAHFSTWGPQAGIGLIVRNSYGTSFHARVSGFVSRSAISAKIFEKGYTGIRDIGKYELFLEQAFGEALSLRAGFVKMELNGGPSWANRTSSSDFRIVSTGPTAELGLHF